MSNPETKAVTTYRYEVTVFHIDRWKREHYGYADTPEAARELAKKAFADTKLLFPQVLGPNND